jgi:hypothetical protein
MTKIVFAHDGWSTLTEWQTYAWVLLRRREAAQPFDAVDWCQIPKHRTCGKNAATSWLVTPVFARTSVFHRWNAVQAPVQWTVL